MRGALVLTGLLVASAVAAPRADAASAPVAAPGYRMELHRFPGMRFSGLAECDGGLLLTDLAAGRIVRMDHDGALARIGPELPYGTDVIGDPTGPYRIAFDGEGLVVAQGWTPVDRGESPCDHSLLRSSPAGGVTILSSDFWNPFDFLVDGGTIYVIDSARNSLERLDANGRRTTLHRFPRLEIAASRLASLSPTEFAAEETYRVDAVPTALALRGDRFFITLFGGFPYLERAGAVVSLDRAAPSAPARLEVGKLDNPVDLAFDGAGTLFVLEHGRFDQGSGFLEASGRLIAVTPGEGSRREVLTGLTRPVSLRMLAAGNVAVTGLDGTVALVAPVSPPEPQGNLPRPCCNAWSAKPESPCRERR